MASSGNIREDNEWLLLTTGLTDRTSHRMIHLFAVLFTLFPGFGTGYLLLGCFRKFVVYFLFSVFLGSFVAIFLFLDAPEVPSGMAVAMLPMLAWNIYHAHKLWLNTPGGDTESETDQNQRPSKVAPIFALAILVLGVVLGILTIPMLMDDEKPVSAGETRQERVVTRLDKHQLVHKARLYNKAVESFYHWYDVEPGGYTLEIYLPHMLTFREIGLMARRIGRYTDDLVYAERFEIYVLNTHDRNALERLAADLSEDRAVDCKDNDEEGVCGYEPR